MPGPTPTKAVDALSTAESPETRQELLRAHSGLRTPKAVQALCDLVVHLLRVDLNRAQMAADSATWLASELDDPRSIALSTRAMGNVHLFRGHVPDAVQCYKAARDAFEELADLEQVANTYLNQISALLQLGGKTEILALAKKARKIFTDLRHELGLARLENNLGILYHRQEDTDRARVHWRAAYERFLALGKSHDAAIALRNLAVAAITSNDYHEALDLYQRVRTFCEEQGLTVLIHEIDYNIAYLYFLRGDYEQALIGYRQARARSQASGDLYHAALCDLDETELYLELNLLEDAAQLADRAIASFRQLQTHHETAKALAFRGIAASRLGDPRLAVDYLRSSRAEFDAEGNKAWASLILLYEALVFHHEGRRYEARRAAEGALLGFEDFGSAVKTALCLLVLSQVELSGNNLSAATDFCERASALLRDSQLPPLHFQTLFTLGEISESRDDKQEAENAYLAAERFLEAMRSRVSTEELRLPLLTNRLEVYDRLLGLLVFSEDRSAFAEIFRLVEKSKARSLSDLLASRVTPLTASTPARSSLVEQVRSLREELNWYYKRYAQTGYSTQPPSEESLQTLRTSLVETERKLAASLSKISEADLELGSLHQALTVDFSEVRKILRHDEVVLQYFVGRDVVYLLWFSAAEVGCEPIAVPAEVNELRRLVEFQLSRLSKKPASDLGSRSSEKTLACLQRLYTLLVEPVEQTLSSYSYITVVPHSFLFYVPFAALPFQGGFLGDHFKVTYAPSASSLFFSKRSDTTAGREVIEFSDPVSTERYSALQQHEGWRATWVPAETPSEIWRALLEEDWALIHLPLGASYRQDNPVLSSIEICQERLTILDLLSIPLRTTVLVATRCGYFPGRSGSGDEFVALSRSLLYSGPKTLLLPLWQPRESAERLFLEVFYRALGSGAKPLDAVSEARRITSERYPHPGDWAAWAPFGF